MPSCGKVTGIENEERGRGGNRTFLTMHRNLSLFLILLATLRLRNGFSDSPSSWRHSPRSPAMRRILPITWVPAVVFLTLWGGRVASNAGIISGTSVPRHLQLPEGVPEIDQAVERFKKGDYEESMALLKKASASHPDLFPARLIFAKICLILDQPAMGRAALEQAVVENPEMPETYLVFGRLAPQDNRLTDAQLQFDKGLALTASGTWSYRWKHDFLIDAHAGLAAVAEHRKDWPAAAANLAAWLQLEPNDGRARQLLAASLFRQGQREKAHVELEQAAKDDPSLEPAAILMGQLSTEVGDLKK